MLVMKKALGALKQRRLFISPYIFNLFPEPVPYMYIYKVVRTSLHTTPNYSRLYSAFARSSMSRFRLGHKVLWSFASLRCLGANKRHQHTFLFPSSFFIFPSDGSGRARAPVCVYVCEGKGMVLTCQLISCAGALMSHVLQWMQLLCWTR